MNNSHDNNPLVSVGLVTYNRVRYLSGVIDSWLAQTYKNFELIISDDASSDETQKICEERVRKDKRIRYFRQKKNLNVPLNFKFVLQEAKGKYFIWATDDDLWDKRLLEDCVNVFQQNPKLVMVFPHMVDIDKDGKNIKYFNPAKYIPLSESLYERLKNFMLFYIGDGKNQLLLGLWERKAILNDPLFGLLVKNDHPPYYWGFDNYFIFCNLAKGPIGFVPQVRFFRRSRVLEDHLSPRQILLRLAFTFFHRLKKIFDSPYFYYIMRRILLTEKLSWVEKLKLLGWNFYIMTRLFLRRKI